MRRSALTTLRGVGRHGIPTSLGAFAIGFDQRDRARLHELWDEIARLASAGRRAR